MTVAIVDYGSGNLRSAAKAFERVAAEGGSGIDVVVTADADVVAGADRVVLPGVGAFADCMRGLEAVDGMRDALEAAVVAVGRPFLGICVGMQLMADAGLEHGRTTGFGWIAGEVRAIRPDDARLPNAARLKVPHMGWNGLAFAGATAHPLFADIAEGAYTYFVHSYQFCPDDPARVLAACDYGGRIIAAVGRDNLVGTQFHPEKSQAVGLALIGNFLGWRP